MRPVAEALYPFTGRFLDLGGLKLHYLDQGSGRAVAMVHGNPTWSFYYRRLVQALSDSHRVVVPDHMGCGLSDKPGDADYDYTLARRIDDLGVLLDHLELDELDLVVHDWGGPIGLGWAVRHPERVRRLVLLNTAAFTLPPGKRAPWQLRLTRTPLGTLLVRGFNAFARGATRMAVTREPMARELRDAYCAPYDSWRDRIATLRFVQDAPLSPADPSHAVLREIEERLQLLAPKPTMICWGELDFVFDLPMLDRWMQLWPHAEVHRFADSGHYVLEDAHDRIIPLVRGFLDCEGAAN